MESNNIKEMAIFEHRFWLQIFGDHSRFIFNALSPKETYFNLTKLSMVSDTKSPGCDPTKPRLEV